MNDGKKQESTVTKCHFQFCPSTQAVQFVCEPNQSQYFSAFQTSCVKVKIVTQQKEIFFLLQKLIIHAEEFCTNRFSPILNFRKQTLFVQAKY